MDRRLVGALTLLLATTAVLVAPALQHPGLSGRASAAALPGPPAVGSCLLVRDAVAGPVDCAEPHDLEVTAGVDSDATTPSPEQCTQRAVDYVAPIRVDDWLVPLAMDVAVIPAPPGERAGDRGWQACTMRPTTHDRFAGTVRGMTLADYRSDVFGSCFDQHPGPKIRCDSPHDAELLGTADVVVTDAAPAGNRVRQLPGASALSAPLIADLTGRCTSLAARLTGVADPTYAGLLGIRMFVRGVDPTAQPDTLRVAVSCVAVAPPGQPLSGSVVGLGTRPLPFG